MTGPAGSSEQIKPEEPATELLATIPAGTVGRSEEVLEESTMAAAAGSRPLPQFAETGRWQPGDFMLNLYEVKEVLGEGAFGVIYQVRHRGWQQDLAVKQPKPEALALAGGKENFIREAETWVRLGLHPHTVSCYYLREIFGIPHVFAEYVAGGSLKDWIETGKLNSLKARLDVAIQFAWGLGYAHEQGLVHQDIKPGNVMLTPEGWVKVTDFGLARSRDMVGEGMAAERSLSVTTAGYTPAYASPEQFQGQKITRKTDIWAYGLTVLAMFTGGATWSVGVAAAQVLEVYLETAGINKELFLMPESLGELLSRCFQDDPQQRPSDLREIVDTLKAIYREATGQAYPRPEPRVGPGSAASLNNRAVSLLDLGRVQEAEHLWEKARGIQPQHPETVYNHGVHLWRTGRRADEELVLDLGGVLQADPGNRQVNYYLALVQMERGDYETALKHLESRPAAAESSEDRQDAIRICRERLSETRKFIRDFVGHSGLLRAVALSGDGRYLISGGQDQTLRWWETATGQCIRVIDDFNDPINALSLSLEGELALSGTAKGELRLWDLVTGKALRTFDYPGRRINSVYLSPEGRYALAGGDIPDLDFLMWDTVTGRSKTFQGAQGQTICLGLSRDGRHIISGGHGWKAVVWNVAGGEMQYVFDRHRAMVRTAVLSRNGVLALTGDDQGNLFLWEVETGRVIREFRGHTKTIHWAAFSREEKFILSGSQHEYKFKVWETGSGRNLFTLNNCYGPYALGADDRLAAIGLVNNPRLLQLNLAAPSYTAPAMLCQIQTSEEAVSIQAALEQNLAGVRQALAAGNYLQAAQDLRLARDLPGLSRSRTLLPLWQDLYLKLPREKLGGAWEEAAVNEAHSRSVARVTISRDGRYVLSAAGIGDIRTGMRVWESSSRNLVQTFQLSAESCCWSSNGKYILSADYGETLRLWELESGQEVSAINIPGNLTRAVWISNGGRFALAGKGGQAVDKYAELALCDLRAARVMRSFKIQEQFTCPVCVSPDEQYIFSVIPDCRLVTWEMATGRQIRAFETELANIKNYNNISQIFLKGDGEVAFTITQNPALSLVTAWRLGTGEKLYSHKIGGDVYGISFDGKLAMSRSQAKINLWDLETGSWLQSLEGHKEMLTCMSFSPDSRTIVSGSLDNSLKFWTLDWELADREQVDWDTGARPFLENFLTRQTPYAGELPLDREPTEEEISLALTRKGKPCWTDEDFHSLLFELGCAGFGWLRPEGVRRQLEKIASVRG